MELINAQAAVNSIVFAAIGIVILLAVFVLIEVITPKYNVWQEIVEKQNRALATLLGSFLLGIAIIIAAAVH